MSNAPLGFGSLAIGGILGIAGITGSSIHSVVQGKPDKAISATAGQSASGGSEEGNAETNTATVPVARGKFKAALEWAHRYIGTPYVWGGSEPGGFDCSGLVQYVYGRAGIHLPRVAQEQYNATRRTNIFTPGVLVFFGTSPTNITHVGIYAGEGKMIDAPHSGANVRVENIPTKIGAQWGSDRVIGLGEP